MNPAFIGMPIKIGSTNGVLYERDPGDGIWKQVESPQIVKEGERRTFSVSEWVSVTVIGRKRGGSFEGEPLGPEERAELCGVTGEGLAT